MRRTPILLLALALPAVPTVARAKRAPELAVADKGSAPAKAVTEARPGKTTATAVQLPPAPKLELELPTLVKQAGPRRAWATKGRKLAIDVRPLEKPRALDVSEAHPTPPKAKLAKQERKKKPEAPCFAPLVHVVRNRGGELEPRDLHLTFCDGTPNPSAVDSLSVLARPRNVERPLLPEIKAYQRRPLDRGPEHKRRKPEYLSESVMRVHPDLAVRLQKIAERFPGKTIEIISGHRPDARFTSRHHHGRALDVHVQGVSREALRDFCRTLEQTGVGYYPNGYFVHVDVRDDKGYWIDRSGPGEPADYGTWPPRKDEIERDRARVIAHAVAELDALTEPLREASVRVPEERDSKARTDAAKERDDALSMHEEEELTREEVAKIKAEALHALKSLED
jgi:hypothetical protein